MTRDWSAYNDARRERDVRPLCAEVIALAGPGAGRTAVDLGCGAGVETRALLAAGWRVLAVDSAPGTVERVGAHRALTVSTVSFADVELPPADLVHAGYSLPFTRPDDFPRLWAVIRAALRPGGWFAGELFGDRDSWAGDPTQTHLTEPAARALLSGMEIVRFDEEDEDGPAFNGPKHWHVFHVIARR